MTTIQCLSQQKENNAVVCNFTFNDTVCMNNPVTITNLSQGASTYYWQFCAGTPLSFPLSKYSGPLPNQINLPQGITLVQEGNMFYAFVTSAGDSTILRITYQNSILNAPTYDKLQIPGILTSHIFGIQVKNDNGNWYGFITNGSTLLRLDFGATLANLSPGVTTIANTNLMHFAQGLVIGYDGQNWVGFCTNFPANTITRFSWGSSLATTPTITDLGNLGGLTLPMQPALINDTSGWYMFVANTTSLVQVQFGNSLLNNPTGTNLGNLTWINDNRGISMFMECGNPYALLENHNVITNQLFQIHFIGGLEGTKIVTPLGNPANLYETTALSESLNIGDTIFCIAVNETPSISIMYFPPCINSVLPNSTLFDPSPVFFPDSGSYTIKLTVDMGLPTQQTVCKEIEVIGKTINLGPDTSLCDGMTLLLNAGTGFKSYLWNTGDTTQTLTVNMSGIYTVTGTNYIGCHIKDSIHVVYKPNTYTTIDTAICNGETYLAGGKARTESGTFIDTLPATNGCKNILTTNLVVKPPVSLTINNDTCITDTTTVKLIARVTGATSYTWQDGTTDSVITATKPGLYWVMVLVNNCSKTDSVEIVSCPLGTIKVYMPNAFTPNGDGVNDVFKPVINEIVNIHLMIYNRWGELIFETHDITKGWDGTSKGRNCEAGAYTYILTYDDASSQNSTKKITGSVILLR
ncbi:MAG: gliding motility-associated C-terminal domain-containing protein [Bacteroidales bacterium]